MKPKFYDVHEGAFYFFDTKQAAIGAQLIPRRLPSLKELHNREEKIREDLNRISHAMSIAFLDNRWYTALEQAKQYLLVLAKYAALDAEYTARLVADDRCAPNICKVITLSKASKWRNGIEAQKSYLQNAKNEQDITNVLRDKTNHLTIKA